MPAEASQLAAVEEELQQLRERGALWLALLRRPAADVAAFAAAARAANLKMRELLGLRAREPQQFRALLRRLKGVCERLALRTQAAGIIVPGGRIESLCHSLEALLRLPQPTGHQLLPLIPAIEELLSLLGSTGLQPVRAALARAPADSSHTRTVRQARTLEPRTAAAKLSAALQRLAAQLAADELKKVRLKVRGFELVPAEWHGNVFDIATQLLRNAIEHGIELPAQRLAANKPELGTVEIEFVARGSEAWELQVRDDGAGVDTAQLVRIATERGLIQSGAESFEDPRRAVGLMFLRGLTTAPGADGRGQGMQIVREQVKRLGGRTQVGTRAGRFTRVRIRLPVPRSRPGPAAAPTLAQARGH